MRDKRVWQMLAGVETGVIETVEVEEQTNGKPTMVIGVRVPSTDRQRCPHCGCRCPGFDAGEGRRRWRALDLGTISCYLEAEAPRVRCRTHGVVVAHTPWARHHSRFTRAFEDQVAWLATHTDRTAIVDLMRIAWRSVGQIIERVSAEGEVLSKRLDGLRRIGIDEVSYRKGHRYLVVVVDHDTDRLLWASPGRDEATLNKFFDLLGAERCAGIEVVSADAASWIRNAVRARCPKASLCMDPFHVIQWATEALDEVRRELWNDARRTGRRVLARIFKGSRWALYKNPENLTPQQTRRLSEIAKTGTPVYRAYLLKEVLREVFKLKGDAGGALLDEFLAWASRSKLKPFVELARKIRRHLGEVHAVLEHGVTNARVEASNTKLRLITRLAFGFHSHEPLIALAMLKLGGLCPPLPGR